MAIKEILVHATHSADCTSRLETAASMAARLDTHLTALYTLWIPPIPTYVEVQLGRELLQRQRELHERDAEDVRTAFDKIVARQLAATEIQRDVHGRR